MATNHNTKRRTAGVTSAKIVIASVSLAATLGGWAAIGALDTTSAANSAPSTALADPAAPPATDPNASTPFGRRNNRRGSGQNSLPAPDPSGGTAPQTQPQQDQPQAQPQQDQPQAQPQQDAPQAQPQQDQSQAQPQQQTRPRFRTRSSR